MKPINLNKYRKSKARADKKARADQNAAKFGRRKDEKSKESAELISLKTHLDGHKRDQDID